MYPALRLPPTGKLTRRISAAAHVCTTTRGRLFVTDRRTKLQFLVDTGSDLCVYPRRLVPRRGERVNYDLCAANGTTIHTYGWLPLSLNLRLRRDFTWRFVIADVTHPIIDVDFLSHFGLLADFRNNRLLDGVTSLSTPAQAASSQVPSAKTIVGGTTVDSLLAEFPDLTRPTGARREVRHNSVDHIRTVPGPPVTCRPRLAPDRLTIAKAEFDAMLREGTARHSESSWSSALHIVPKKDNGWRPCGDNRALNARTIPDRYLVRHIHDYSHQLFGCSIFPKSTWYEPTIKFPFIPTTYRRPPLPFLSAGSSFLSCSSVCATPPRHSSASWTFCEDLPFASPTWTISLYYLDHAKSTSNICGHFLNNFRGTGSSSTRLSASFEHPRSTSSVARFPPKVSQPLEERVTNLRDCPPPTTASQFRRFLGMLNFYSRFLPHAADTQAPLYAALSGPRVKGSHPITWTPELLEAFEECKASVTCYSTGASLSIRTAGTCHRRLHDRHGCRAAATRQECLAAPRVLFIKAQPGTAEVQRLRP
jgi:cleavage and polyadenylation specificity factor subunit 1